MAFDDVRFPVAISHGATGGPERRTEIVTLASGHEERNSRWAHSRRRYNAGFGVKSLNDLHEVLKFFEERRGRLHGFRWKDHADYKSCPPQNVISMLDQQIGVGDGLAVSFQLVKAYGSGLRNYARPITKPVAASVVAAVDGISTAVTADPLTGLVTFSLAPAVGAIVTAGFEFDVPSRFDSDQLSINVTTFNAGDIPDIPVVELRA
jgi:uncharacterized protein (TIGR02217 family)